MAQRVRQQAILVMTASVQGCRPPATVGDARSVPRRYEDLSAVSVADGQEELDVLC